MLKFQRLKIPEVLLIKPRIFEDARGFFMESYSRRDFSEVGVNETFVQDNHSKSARGVLRGLHYQTEPKAQAKLMRVLRGKVFDVVVDIRPASPTFGQHVTCVLSEENKNVLYVPIGFAHGFCVLEDNTEFFYKVSEFYSVEHERGIIWNDPALKIAWPEMDYVLSDKDQKHPTLQQAFRL